ncbi:MAG: hypothetical protein FK734_16010 [Asgard group archaeon]|nr:hypothetical protein [Asgard group archaeon]
MTQLKTLNSLQKRQYSNIMIFFLILLLGLMLVQLITTNTIADDNDSEDDDDEDLSQSLGWASIGLFVVSSIYIVFYQTFKLTRKINSEGRATGFKEFIANTFRKVRKPLLYIHYFSGLAALGVLLAHGILLTNDDSEAIIGWVSAGIYIFYILTGILLWFKIISPKRNLKLRKVVLYLHRSLLLFAAIIIIHIIHVAISD